MTSIKTDPRLVLLFFGGGGQVLAIVIIFIGVSSDATKLRIVYLYANEQRHNIATTSRSEDRAHVICLL